MITRSPHPTLARTLPICSTRSSSKSPASISISSSASVFPTSPGHGSCSSPTNRALSLLQSRSSPTYTRTSVQVRASPSSSSSSSSSSGTQQGCSKQEPSPTHQQHNESETTPDVADVDVAGNADVAGVWFFEYGPLMNTTLLVDRGLEPIESVSGCLPGYRLAFDIDQMQGAGAAAAVSVRASSGEEVHGVLYKFTDEVYKTLLQQQNAVVGYDPSDRAVYKAAYCAFPQQVYVYDGDGEPMEAQVLLNRRTVESEAAAYWGHGGSDQHTFPSELLPSEPYLASICEGARQHGIDSEYIEKISSTPCADTATDTTSDAANTVYEFWGKRVE